MLPRTPYIKPTFKLILESALVKDYLPWRTRFAVTLVVIPLNGLEIPTQPIQPFEDPSSERLVLRPGEASKGTISLRDYCEQFDALASRGDLALFWSFELVDSESQEAYGRFSGFFEIPASNPKANLKTSWLDS